MEAQTFMAGLVVAGYVPYLAAGGKPLFGITEKL